MNAVKTSLIGATALTLKSWEGPGDEASLTVNVHVSRTGSGVLVLQLFF